MLRMFRGANKRTKTIWWFLIVLTVVTFVGGFVVLFGLGMDQTRNARGSGAVGLVNGKPISQADYQSALNDQRENYRRQYGSDPADRDARLLEIQAWRGLVTQRLMANLANSLGIKAHDREVVLSLETSPPPQLASSPNFQTNGKFDSDKYERALRNTGNNWAPFEDMIRSQLPTRKLEERLIASIKISQPELLETIKDRFETANAVVVQVPPATDAKLPSVTPADLDRMYKEYGGRFTSDTRVQLEVVNVPLKYTDEDLRTAKQQAQSLVDRARKGEDFFQLAKDYSEGAGAEQGGRISRPVQSSEFGVFGQHLETLPVGGVSDAFQDGGHFVILKVLDRVPQPGAPTPSMHVAQIVIKAHANENAIRDQAEDLAKLRKRALAIGLGRAAAEKGLGTARTRPYDASSTPEELYMAPEAADWGLNAKKGQVSPVIEGVDQYVIAQVAERHEAGPAKREELGDPLRQLADMDGRIHAAKNRSDAIGAALASGKTLEQAAAGVGLTPLTVTGLNRAQPDPRLGGAPELVGALFAAPVGKVVGPVRTLSGWYYGRVDSRTVPPDSTLNKMRGQVTTEALQRRQQTFFTGFVSQLRSKAKVQDLRNLAAQ